MERKAFGERLAQLRMSKGVSARDMSLSLGQSPGYINNVENGVNLPSMTVFFYICDYFHITPRDFFDTSMTDPCKISELIEAVDGLNEEQLDHLIYLAKGLTRTARAPGTA